MRYIFVKHSVQPYAYRGRYELSGRSHMIVTRNPRSSHAADEVEDLTTVGGRIRAQRIAMGLSMVALAKKVGVTRSTIWQWETGTIKNIEGVKFIELAIALSVNARWLAGKDDSPVPYQKVTVEEAALLERFRKLPSEDARAEVLDFVRFKLAKDVPHEPAAPPKRLTAPKKTS